MQNNFKQDPSQNKKNKSKNPIAKVSIILVSILVLLFGIVGVSAFAGNEEQSFLSMLLDSSGQHQAAFSLDAFRKNPTAAAQLANSSFSPESCSTQWKNNNFLKDDVYATSATFNQNIAPANSEWKGKYYLNSSFAFALDFDQVATSAKLDVEAKVDLTEIRKAYELSEEDIPTEFDQVQVNLNGQGVLTKSDAYVKLDNASLTNADATFSASLNNWYRQNYGLSETQQEGVTELSGIAKDIINLDYSQAVSEDIINDYSELSCEKIENVEILEIQEKEFDGEKIRVRPIQIEMKEVDIAKETEEMEALNKRLLEDETLKDFLKNQYELAQRITTAGNKISELTEGFELTKEEYKQGVDDFFANEIENKEQFEEMEEELSELENGSQIEDYFEIITQPTIYYLDAQSLELSGVESSIKFELTDLAFEELIATDPKNQFIQTVLGEGLEIKTSLNNIKLNDKANKVEIPTEFKELEEFNSDFEESSLGQQAEEITESLPNPFAAESEDFSSENYEPEPFDYKEFYASQLENGYITQEEYENYISDYEELMQIGTEATTIPEKKETNADSIAKKSFNQEIDLADLKGQPFDNVYKIQVDESLVQSI